MVGHLLKSSQQKGSIWHPHCIIDGSAVSAQLNSLISCFRDEKSRELGGRYCFVRVRCLRRATLGNAARSLLENTSDEKLNEVEERSLSVGGYAIAQTINSVKTTNKVVIMSVLDKHLDFLRNDALIHDDSQSKLALNTNEPSVDSTM